LVARVAYEKGHFLFFGRLSAKLNEGATEVTLASLDELRAPTMGTLGFSYQLPQAKITAAQIQTDCQDFRRDVFSDFDLQRPNFKPIKIENGECTIDHLLTISQNLHDDALRARNEKLNALCDEYNSKRGSGRLRATRLDDPKNAPMVFEDNAKPLEELFPKPCTEANLIEGVKQDAVNNVKPLKPGGAGAESEEAIKKKFEEAKEEAGTAAENGIIKNLADAALPFCQTYNNHAYPLLRTLEPQGALTGNNDTDRGCSNEEKLEALKDPSISDATRMKWQTKVAGAFPFIFWNVTGFITEGKSTFTIFDPAKFDPTSAKPVDDASRTLNKTSRNLSLGITRFTNLWSVGASYMRKLDVNEPSKTQVCLPIANTNVEHCISALIDAPSDEETNIIALEAKAYISSSFGANLKILRDLKQSKTEPHLGLYFLSLEGKGLAGGIDLSYNDKDHFSGRVFVGAAFSVFPKQ
jgi:hypothetical protein